VFGIFASIAEFERSLITERVKSGQAAAKRRGIKFGRPRVDVDTKRIAELRRQGISYANIAKATGVSVGTIFRAMDS
jgi:DNA invertase Pin-like site-specific DNA recombinase